MPDPRQFLTMLRPDRLAMMQGNSGPGGLASFLQTPGLREGMLMAGLRLLGSDTKRESFGQALGDAVTTGLASGREAATREQYDAMLEGAPPQMRQLLKVIGPERGALLLAQQAMAGPAAPTAVNVNERLVAPDGSIIVDAVPETPEAVKPDIRNVGDTLVDVTDPANPAVLYDAPDGGPDFGEVAQLRNRFEDNVKPYETAAQAFRKMEASATGEATPAKDIALVFNYMKAIDPASSVREGEFATAQNAGSAWTIAGNLYNRLLTGNRLNQSQREEFLNSAREQIASLLPQYQTVADQYRGIAEDNRFDPTQIIRNPFSGLNLAPATTGAADDPLGIR